MRSIRSIVCSLTQRIIYWFCDHWLEVGVGILVVIYVYLLTAELTCPPF